MAARLVELPRPEGGAEREVDWIVHHNCDPGKALRRELGESVDEIHFPIGLIGWQMPIGVAFEVIASHECMACNAWLRIWAKWTGPKMWLPK